MNLLTLLKSFFIGVFSILCGVGISLLLFKITPALKIQQDSVIFFVGFIAVISIFSIISDKFNPVKKV